MSFASDIKSLSSGSRYSGSEEPKVIDSVTSEVTPEQAFESFDLTDPSTFINTTSNQSANMNNLSGGNGDSSSGTATSGTVSSGTVSSGTDYVTTDSTDKTNTEGSFCSTELTTGEPDYYIYLDPKNATLLKEFLINFVKIKSELQARDMVNMELLNPDSAPESPDHHLVKLMAQALTLLKNENSEEKNQITNLYSYYAERAKSFMFFLLSDLLKDNKNKEIRCDLKSTKTDTLIENCKIAGINNNLYMAVEISLDKSDPENTTGEDIITYVGVSPFVSLRGKTGEDADEPEGEGLITRTREMVEQKSTDSLPKSGGPEGPNESASPMISNLRVKSTPQEMASYFNADMTESGEGEPSIPHITSANVDSENAHTNPAADLRDRVKNLITGYQRGGQNNEQNSNSGEEEKKSSTSATQTPTSTPSTNTSISSTDSSNIIILRGGAHVSPAGSPAAPQTEVDVRLRELLDQSKPGKRDKFESTSSPMAGLCE
jgi:hypothetical protein